MGHALLCCAQNHGLSKTAWAYKKKPRAIADCPFYICDLIPPADEIIRAEVDAIAERIAGEFISISLQRAS